MLRAIILSMVLFLALGTIVPIATEQTEAGSVQQEKRKVKKKHRASKYRKYRRYRKAKRYQRSRRYSSSKKRYTRTKSRYQKKKRRTVKRSKKVRKYSAKRSVKKKRKVRRYTAKRKVRRKSVKRYSKKSRKYTAKRNVSRKPRVRKYSKKWWRQYRARKARSNAIAKRKRALRLRRIRLAKQKRNAKSRRNQNAAVQKSTVQPQQAAMLPSGSAAPSGWVQNDVSGSSLLFNVDGANGAQIGSASLTVLGPATGQTVANYRNSSVGGIATTTLRRTVIDQMLRENGWVENDYQKEIGGKSVYVVVAKTEDTGNRIQSRTFYFTEANGRIYSLATKSSKEDSEKIVRQSEKVLESLQNRGAKVQQAKN